MHIISRKALIDFWKDSPAAESPLEHWYKAVRNETWNNFADVRETFGAADQAGKCVVFNVGGGKYRLVVAIHYPRTSPQGRTTEGRVFIRNVLTHKEYDKGAWKRGCGCKD